MRQHRVLPEIEARVPHSPLPERKRPPDIPAMGHTAPPSHFSREQVIAAIQRQLRGETCIAIAADIGAHAMTVYHWCRGHNRRACLMEAERRHQAELKAAVGK